MIRARLDKRPADVAAMFDQVAERYDLLNDVLSLGQDRWWRRVVARAVNARASERVLDLAAGTGTSSQTFTTAGAACVACDFSLGMLRVGRQRLRKHSAAGPPGRRATGLGAPLGMGVTSRPKEGHGCDTHALTGAGASRAGPDARKAGPVRFVAGDALRLPFRDRSFDAVTISFGLRNVASPDAALAEMLRVTRPGGRLVICEFGHLPWAWADALYERYLAAALPAMARRLSRAGDAYEYLAESIRAWPAAPELGRRISEAGWSAVRWRNLTLGVVTVHAARRPQ